MTQPDPYTTPRRWAMTVEEFERFVLLPEHREMRFEWHHGETIQFVPDVQCAIFTGRLIAPVIRFVQERGLGYCTGPDGYYIVNGARYLPGMGYVSHARDSDETLNLIYNPRAPDLAIEVIYPTELWRDTTRQIANYMAAGTMVWQIYREGEIIAVYTPGQPHVILTVNDTLDGGTVLPGFSLSLMDVFRNDVSPSADSADSSGYPTQMSVDPYTTPRRWHMPVEEFERFVLLPEHREMRFEWHHGETIQFVPDAQCGLVSGRIAVRVGAFVLEHRVGYCTMGNGYYIVNGARYLPSVAYVSYARRVRIARNAIYYPEAPDLAVIVIFPTYLWEDIRSKISNYRMKGSVVWLVYPQDQRIQVFEAGKPTIGFGINDVLDGGTVLPGFSLPLMDVFHDDMPFAESDSPD